MTARLGLPTLDTAKRAATLVIVIVIAGGVLMSGAWLINRLMPRHDPTPIVIARQDERKAATTSEAIGTAVAAQTRDSAVHVDITTKEIRDAFEIKTPVPAAPAAGPADMPAAPVGRLRERLNESIARANRAAGAADDPD